MPLPSARSSAVLKHTYSVTVSLALAATALGPLTGARAQDVRRVKLTLLTRSGDMVNKLSGFMKKRRESRLYEQWVTRDGLPPDEVPQEPQSIGSTDMEDMTEDNFYGAFRGQSLDPKSITLPVRYVLIGLGIMAVLLVVVAILATVIAMGS